jgi:hypothetical protein
MDCMRRTFLIHMYLCKQTATVLAQRKGLHAAALSCCRPACSRHTHFSRHSLSLSLSLSVRASLSNTYTHAEISIYLSMILLHTHRHKGNACNMFSQAATVYRPHVRPLYFARMFCWRCVCVCVYVTCVYVFVYLWHIYLYIYIC